MSERKSALPPSVHVETRVLLLGSLPGERSLAAQEYYAHPSNAFWWLVGELCREDMVALPYLARLELLRSHGVGLWDVVASASRIGSLDTAIRDVIPRNLVDFAKHLPELRAIGFNGLTAARLGRRQLAEQEDRWTLINLPSSSAAYAGISRSAKLTAWSTILPFLR